MGKGLLGLELEFHLIDEYGNIVNDAETIIEDSRNNGNILRESSKSMVELISKPASKLSDLEANFKGELSNLIDICDSYGYSLLPTTTISPDYEVVSNDDIRSRGMKKRKIVGNELRDLEHLITGTHIHVDKLNDFQLDNQYNVMQAMDPVFAFMSYTPFFLGKNSKKDYRVDVYRNVVHEEFPLQGSLLDYPKSYQDAVDRQIECYNDFVVKAKEKDEDLGDDFNINNCLWGPLRISKHTIEARNSDSNNFSELMAFSALYKGINKYLEKSNPDVVISSPSSGFNYFVPQTNDGIETLFIPSYDVLKQFEYEGINNGLENDGLHNYLSNILNLSKIGLDKDEHKYLKPFEEMIVTRKNNSDYLVEYAKINGLENNRLVSADNAKLLRLYIADQFINDFKKYT
jgi:hypothetical protein